MHAHDPSGDHDAPSLDDLSSEERDRIYEAAKHHGSDIPQLQALTIGELLELARREGIEVVPNLSKPELLFEILKNRFARTGLGWAEGVLEVLPDGFGFLRSARYDYEPGPDDVYVSPSQVRRLNLKPGHLLAGPVRPPKRGEKYFALLHVELVNGGSTAELRRRIPFDARTPLLPRERLRLDCPGATDDVRLLDLLAPWGRGQRVLISAPPGSGRTLLLARIARSLLHNHPDCHVLVCLLDERPEEITELRRGLQQPNCEVVATSFDAPPARHVALAEMALAKAQRMVEAGSHVILFVDSLTALVRAYSLELPHSGKVLTAGLDAAALQRPKRLFGAARYLEEGGSLTVIATALAGTDSRVDQVIAEEFQNKGNSEVVLDRALADQHVQPALDVLRTGTRREDDLLPEPAIRGLRALRREIATLSLRDRLDRLLRLLQQAPDNDILLQRLVAGDKGNQGSRAG